MRNLVEGDARAVKRYSQEIINTEKKRKEKKRKP
jgi:hypothetical protein